MKTLKKFLCIITVFVLVLSLVGCMENENPGIGNSNDEIKKETDDGKGKENNDNSIEIAEFLEKEGRTYLEESIKKSFGKNSDDIEVCVVSVDNKIQVVIELSKVTELDKKEKENFEKVLNEEKENLKEDLQPVADKVPNLETIDLILTRDGGVETKDGVANSKLKENRELEIARVTVSFNETK